VRADVSRYLFHRRLVERQGGKAEFPGVNPGNEPLYRRPRLLAVGLQVGLREPVAAAHQLRAQVCPVVAYVLILRHAQAPNEN
jgi:hypothetical protein